MRVIRTGVAVVLVAVTSVAAQAQAKPAAPAAAAKPATADQAVKVKEDKPGLLKKAKVTAEVAIAAAQAKFPKGKLSSAEIEEEDGKLIFSLDFKTEGKSGIDEVAVDALTGKVLKSEHESPESEAKEAKADKAKADKDKAAAAKPAPKTPV
jgi:uncharacterized membrane protein YkoI